MLNLFIVEYSSEYKYLRLKFKNNMFNYVNEQF
jgi:hypothetical protein